MVFSEFKDQVLKLAEDESVELTHIQAVITDYYKDKPLPYLQSVNTFVVGCGVNLPGEEFKNVSRCSDPPDDRKAYIPLQRGTYPGQQGFYCSMPSDSDYATASATCMMETAWEHVEDLTNSRTYLTLSRWQNSRALNLWVLPFSDKSCQKNRDFERIRKNMSSLVDKRFHDSLDVLASLEFISDAFCENRNKKTYYRITSPFYNALLSYEQITGTILDGLMYPSANTEKAGLNLLLKKDLVDNKILTCDVAMMYSMQRLPYNPKHLQLMPASNEAKPEADGGLRFSTII